MANARGQVVDVTCLKTLGFLELRGCIHRDYMSHVLRYNHVVQYLLQGKRHQTAHVLDVGCGREAPLAATLYSMYLTHTTGSYTAVDYGPIERPYYLREDRELFKVTWLPNADFATVALPQPRYDLIVMLEVVEHVELWHAYRMLRRARELLAPGGVLFLSTPCYDERMGAADSHVNEMSRRAVRDLLGAAGFTVVDAWGMFASWRDWEPLIDRYAGLRDIVDRLKTYYESNVISCLFAPMFPDAARNCLWRADPGPVVVPERGPWLDPVNSSSARWPVEAQRIYEEASRVK